MAILKCKMCGGDIVVDEEKTFGTCEYCGSVMTLPKVSDDQRAARFNRGNHFRRQGDFDKALAVYESIVREDDTDAEAHWCCALCRFGIEYVEDPNTYEFIPTCHRASFDSFTEDVDYLAALENSDGITRRQYQKDAAKIAEVQRGILATSQNEEPYDVFICYKETDDSTTERTRDSLDAQDIYYQLTQEGYRVFFSRITLEDKVGAEYEPYIFAALNSAKVMVAIGSKPEYFNAVWVKNEWSRFLAMMRKDRSKLLLPCYKGMDPYDMPEQLGVLQSYDMTKIGFMQDLIRGIKKVLRKDEPKETVKEKVVVQHTGGTNIAPLLKRVFMYLEDGDWKSADEYAERVLDQDPENAEAYVGKLMAELRVNQRADLKNQAEPFDEKNNFKKAIRFGDDKTKDELNGYISHINTRNKNEIYAKACALQASGEEQSLAEAVALFKGLKELYDCPDRARVCTRAYEEKKAAREEKKAAEVKQKAAEVKQKAVAVVAAFKAHCGEKREPTIEEKYAATKARIESLTALQNGFDALLALATQLRQEQAALASEEANISAQLYALTSQEKQLTAQRTKLGIFAGKEKKRIDGELSLVYAKKNEVSDDLSSLAARKRELDDRIRQNAQQRCGFDSMADIDREIAKENATASGLESQIASKRANEELIYSYEEAIKVYLGEPEVTRAVNTELYPTMYRNSIAFGRYIQKENGSPEPIEWRILARENGRMLVISKYALDSQRYNTSSENVTWKTCSLRKWLNGAFLNAAFNSVEQNSIISSNDISSDATDKIFLLTQYQAREYFSSDKERQCQGTAYFKAKKPARKDNSEWWLGERGSRFYNAAYVNCDGRVVSREDILCGANYAVRPAMWIKIES